MNRVQATTFINRIPATASTSHRKTTKISRVFFADVNDDDFLVPYSEKAMKEILDGAGIDYGNEATFKALYADAQAKCDQMSISGGVPIEIFRRMLLGIPV